MNDLKLPTPMLDEALEWAKEHSEAINNLDGKKLWVHGFSRGQWCEQQKMDDLVRALELALRFAPKGPVPPGLCPTFYRTLDYNEEVKLQEKIDKARELLDELKSR